MQIPLTKEAIQELPGFIGIYIFSKKGKIFYIGKSINVKTRLLSHLENAKIDAKEALIIKNSDIIECIETDSEFKALLLESELIKTHLPKYNVRWRDNKSYLYIKVTIKDEYPKVLTSRRENDGKSLYFGPFPSRLATDEIIKELRRIFPFCTQKNISRHPCFYSKIGLCNPCPNWINSIETQNVKHETLKLYKSNIRQVIKILQGKTDVIQKNLHTQIKAATKKQDYETALLVRNKLFRFERLIYQRLFDTNDLQEYNQSEKSIKELSTLLKHFMPSLLQLKRIECYDISNLSFKEATASMVVSQDGQLAKSEYRKFKIINPKPRSDFEMIDEIIRRRFKNKWTKPNLVVIDGGKPQVRVVLHAFAKENILVPVIGLAKNPDRIVIGIDGLPTIRPALNNHGFNLLRLIRDESHRFAKKYHTELRRRKLLL